MLGGIGDLLLESPVLAAQPQSGQEGTGCQNVPTLKQPVYQGMLGAAEGCVVIFNTEFILKSMRSLIIHLMETIRSKKEFRELPLFLPHWIQGCQPLPEWGEGNWQKS